jgi:Zn-dependent protease with chaperone function
MFPNLSPKICDNPLSLANALAKLEAGAGSVRTNVNPSTAHMFIVNPLKGKAIATLFSTHPSTEERIARSDPCNEIVETWASCNLLQLVDFRSK